MWGMAGTGKGITPRQRAFGDRVRAYRHDLRLSQDDLALKANVNRSYIASLEGGQRNPSLELIAKLAAALEVDAGDLVRGLQDEDGRR